jgi:hypothetical protein
MPKVEMERTVYDEPTVASALERAFEAKGEPLDRTAAAMLLAHIYLETADRQALWNNNAGNITTGDTSQDYWQPTKGPAAKLKFKVYPTLDAGLTDYATSPWSRKLLAAARSGDAGRFAQVVNDTGYTPGIDVGAFAKIIEQKTRAILARPVLNTLALGAAVTNHAPSGGKDVAIIALLVLAVYWLSSRTDNRKKR